MSKKDQQVDAISTSADFAKPILLHFRKLIHRACPSVEESIKWRFPHFEYNGILCHIGAFKHHCSFGFWRPEMQEKLCAAFDQPRGHFVKVASVSELPKDSVLLEFIKDAMKLNESGSRPARVRKAAARMKMPTDLAAALKMDKKAHTHFSAMSMSQRNEYIEWIIDAKRPETRAKRIATALQWLAQGKSRNWKYE